MQQLSIPGHPVKKQALEHKRNLHDTRERAVAASERARSGSCRRVVSIPRTVKNTPSAHPDVHKYLSMTAYEMPDSQSPPPDCKRTNVSRALAPAFVISIRMSAICRDHFFSKETPNKQ
jgi:hypothetical protein